MVLYLSTKGTHYILSSEVGVRLTVPNGYSEGKQKTGSHATPERGTQQQQQHYIPWDLHFLKRHTHKHIYNCQFRMNELKNIYWYINE